ncbi:MAG: hypothetical protein AAGJ82_13990, partial [Bacteroidota bacterium]
WKLKRVGAFGGQDQDMIGDMSHDFFLSSITSNLDFDYANLNTTERHTYSMLCENPHFRLNAVFQNQYLENLEFGLSLVGIFNRIDEIVYVTPGSDPWDYGAQQLRFTQYGHELGIEPTLGYRSQRGAFALTGIVGTNVGYTFGNNLAISGNNLLVCDDVVSFRDGDQSLSPDCETIDYLYDYSDQGNGIALRGFAEINASFTLFKRVEMGTMLRRGLGVRLNHDAPNTTTNLHSFGFFTRWVLK